MFGISAERGRLSVLDDAYLKRYPIVAVMMFAV